MQHSFWKQGLRFECEGKGHCCHARGEYSFVYLSAVDRQRLAESQEMRRAAFTQRYCGRVKSLYYLIFQNGTCPFLLAGRCTVYEARPDQCRTWPFWRENLLPETWQQIATMCPGIGKGRLYHEEEILQHIERADRAFRD